MLGVLEGVLAADGGRQSLVGGKMTFADMAFVSWNERLDDMLVFTKETKFDGFPNLKAWHERITSQPAWKRAMQKRNILMGEQGLREETGMPDGLTKHPGLHSQD